jgi:serine/threonine protein kinase/Flp pilus assembly protein TadD
MTTWNPHANDLFLKALELCSADQRQKYLEEACTGDEALRAEVESLLEASAQAAGFLESPAAGLAATMDEPITERPGTIIGKYKLLEQSGEGAVGIVFMAEQQHTMRRKVAVKILKLGMDTRQVVARFEAERQALALMDHPNIAKVLDAGQTDNGRPYFVMELVKGLPITESCDQAKLPIHDRLELFLSVCQAVQHAHQKGIIHRDIKPSNVMVTLHDGAPLAKVIDFGIAKALGQELTDKTLYTGFAQLIGTPLYMSPEQAAFSNIDVDTRSDIYSLGVLLYELLTGTTPFDKGRLHQAGYDELRRIIREEEPPKPSTRISTMGQTATAVSTQRQSDPKRLGQFFRAELDWIVMKCLEKDRNRRYETANSLARDIQRYLNDEPVQACPPSAWYRFRKFARRKKMALAMAACVFLALAGIAGSVGWAVRDRVARDHDQAAREEALDEEAERLLDESGPLIELGKWPEALAAVERADKLLASAGRKERSSRLLELQKGLRIAQRLEEIYGLADPGVRGNGYRPQELKASAADEFYLGREQDQRFALAFREFDIDIDILEPAEAAARIGRTTISQALVRALDEWAAMRKHNRRDDDTSWRKLLWIALKADPDEWRNRFREALLLWDREALRKLAEAVPIREVPPATVYVLGHALNNLGALDKAIDVLREAQRYHPNDYLLNMALGWFSEVALKPPRYSDALRYYASVLAVRPQDARAHRHVAEVLMRTNALEEGLAEYSRAIELEPEQTTGWLERGIGYHLAHRYEMAVADYSKVIELRAKFIEVSPQWFALVFNNRGDAYNQLHQYQNALADLSRAIELESKWAAPWTNRGLVHYRLGNWDKAFGDYSKALELEPKAPWVQDQLAWVLAICPETTLRNPQRAVELATRALNAAPENGNFWTTQGAALYRSGEWKAAALALQEAEKLLQGAAGFNSRLGRTFLFQAMAQQQSGNGKEARLAYDRALQWLETNRKALNEDSALADELRRFRAEAAALLVIEVPPVEQEKTIPPSEASSR